MVSPGSVRRKDKGTFYHYDGDNDVADYDASDNRSRYYVHGVSYIDERLMMYHDSHEQPYFYAIDRQYSVVALLDRTGGIMERYTYDSYGRPLIRETPGRADIAYDGQLDWFDRLILDVDFISPTYRWGWDPRADIDDDGDADADDLTARLHTGGAFTANQCDGFRLMRSGVDVRNR